jgi:hypothetical protein
LGFAVDFVFEGIYAGLSRDDCRLHLKQSAPSARDQVAFEQAEHIDVCIGVSDAEGMSSSLAAAGVHFTVPLRSMPYGQEFYVRDPDGYILGFVEAAPASG